MADSTNEGWANEVKPPDTRVICPACDGTCWSRSARGRCMRCKGVGLVEPVVATDDNPSGLPELGPQSAEQGAKPPHIARAVLVGQRDVRYLGGAKRTAIDPETSRRYADAEEIISLAGDVLLPLGVAASIDHVEPQLEPGGTRRLAVTCLLEHPESGERWSRVRHAAVVDDGHNTLSQAENAAETNALAYFLRDTLQIPRGYRSADVALGPMTAPDTSQVLAGPTAPEKRRERRAPAVNESSSVNAFLGRVSAAKSVAELDVIGREAGKAVKRRELASGDFGAVVEAITEARPRCEANDASAAAEGPQGRAA